MGSGGSPVLPGLATWSAKEPEQRRLGCWEETASRRPRSLRADMHEGVVTVVTIMHVLCIPSPVVSNIHPVITRDGEERGTRDLDNSWLRGQRSTWEEIPEGR